jgi:hypothetical protein
MLKTRSTGLVYFIHFLTPKWAGPTFREWDPDLTPLGDAHGHGPYPITNGERTLLSAWLKQGRDWLML